MPRDAAGTGPLADGDRQQTPDDGRRYDLIVGDVNARQPRIAAAGKAPATAV